MLPFSQSSQRSRQVIEKNKQDFKLITPAMQDFLQTQEELGGDSNDTDAPGSDDIDPAQFEHDMMVVQDSVIKAIEQVNASQGVSPTKSELRDAQSIMSVVSETDVLNFKVILYLISCSLGLWPCSESSWFPTAQAEVGRTYLHVPRIQGFKTSVASSPCTYTMGRGPCCARWPYPLETTCPVANKRTQPWATKVWIEGNIVALSRWAKWVIGGMLVF